MESNVVRISLISVDKTTKKESKTHLSSRTLTFMKI
eukprot:UN04907